MPLLLKTRESIQSKAETFFDNERMVSNAFDFAGGLFVSDGSLFDFNGEEHTIPNVNMVESDSEYKLELIADSSDQKNFKVEVVDGFLTVVKEKKEETENLHDGEFFCDSFLPRFFLPEKLITEEIHTKYENGIFHLRLPKKETNISKPAKQINIV